MSILANATYISPGNPFYAVAGSGGGGGGGALVGNSLALNSPTSGQIIQQKYSFDTFIVTQIPTYNPPDPAPPERVLYSVNNTTGDITFTSRVNAFNLINVINTLPTLVFPMGLIGSYPTSPATGVVAGQTFTPQRTGVYFISATLSMNVDPAPVVVGESDFVNIALNDETVPVIGLTFKPFNMTGAVAGQDYGLQSSKAVVLTAFTVYTLSWWVTNLSGTINLGNANGGGQLSIIQLC